MHATMPHCLHNFGRNRAWQVSSAFSLVIIYALMKFKHRHHNPSSLLHPSSPHQGPIARRSTTPNPDYTLPPLPTPSYANSLPAHSILGFNLRGLQFLHLYPQHSANSCQPHRQRAPIALEPQFSSTHEAGPLSNQYPVPPARAGSIQRRPLVVYPAQDLLAPLRIQDS